MSHVFSDDKTKPVAAPTATPPADQPTTAGVPAVLVAVPTVKVASGDTPWTDTDGNTFIVPDGWKVPTLDTTTAVTAPEGDSGGIPAEVAERSRSLARQRSTSHASGIPGGGAYAQYMPVRRLVAR